MPLRLAACLSIAVAALCACSESTAVVARDLPSVIARDAAATDATGPAAADATIDSGRRVPTDCGGRPCACDNGQDDDADALIDGLDPECTGPYDDDEATFSTGLPGANRDFCQDCFFDDNSGGDDDGCQYHSECLFGRVPAMAAQSGCFDCQISTRCVDSCRPRTPNGCDCFGCCEVTRDDGSVVPVLLTDDCSLKDVDDPSVCTRCVPHPTCRNECGVCELCPGKKRRDLPQVCRGKPEDDTPGFSCDEGEQVCDESLPCPRDFYCHLGCCLFVPQ